MLPTYFMILGKCQSTDRLYASKPKPHTSSSFMSFDTLRSFLSGLYAPTHASTKNIFYVYPKHLRIFRSIYNLISSYVSIFMLSDKFPLNLTDFMLLPCVYSPTNFTFWCQQASIHLNKCPRCFMLLKVNWSIDFVTLCF